jgi:hypothetical protein
LPAFGGKKILGKLSEIVVGTFRVGDLIRMKEDCWWLGNHGTRFRTYTEKDRLVLVIKSDGLERKGFFYGRICSTGEERLWTADEFELVSSPR